MQNKLVSFINVLRSHDLRISPAETLDAMDVVACLGYADRQQLRSGLALALAKTVDEKAIFSRCFDRFFNYDQPEPGAAAQTWEADDPDGDAADASQEAAPTALQEALAENSDLQSLADSELLGNLQAGNRDELSLAIAQAAQRVGLDQIKMFTQKGQYTRRMLDELGEEVIRRGVIALEQADSPALVELQRYRDILRELVRDHVEREYLLHAEGRNKQFMDDILASARLNNIEHHYLHRVHDLVRKMARKLAARHARKRKVYKRGQLNMAKTMRRGIPHDGVMFQTYWKQVRKDKPQLLAICDVSGSVAAYAKFLLMFLYSLQDLLPRVRSFAFSSHLGEVSELFEQYPLEKAIELVNWKYGGATDYGNSLLDFARLALDDINSSTTVIILGDARNNNGDPQLEVMQGIYQRARQVIWLNPESRKVWGSGDSEMLRYQSACHFSAECNNLKQLERIIDQLLKRTR